MPKTPILPASRERGRPTAAPWRPAIRAGLRTHDYASRRDWHNPERGHAPRPAPPLAKLSLRTLAAAALSAPVLHAQAPADLASAPGDVLYQASCANCHGADGRGTDPALLAFEEEMPDFTDCDFAAREPDADWIAVAHEGGPVRGFSEMMPAFGSALAPEQLQRVMNYIRTMCTDAAWPRGELNLPRPLVTGKAYPEDEWVVSASLDGTGEGAAEFVYEQRFGPRSQWEVAIPYEWNRREDGGGGRLGELEFSVKHAVYHSAESGSIVSVSGDLHLPAGSAPESAEPRGASAAAFAHFGQLVGQDSFLQAQAGARVPMHSGGSARVYGRLVWGRGFASGVWGRSWTPMVELLTDRAVGGGADGAETQADIVPQLQVALNTRQHVLANFGLLVPLTTDADGRRRVRLVSYVLLDWFDGGFWEGW